MVPVRDPVIVPVREPVIVPVREPVIVPVRDPVIVPVREPEIVPPNEICTRLIINSPAEAIRLTRVMSILPVKNGFWLIC